MSAGYPKKPDRIIESYVKCIRSAKKFDKRTEFLVAEEIWNLQTERWAELLCDDHNPNLVERALLSGARSLYRRDETDSLSRSIKNLRAADDPVQYPNTFGKEFLGALDSVLLVLNGMDKQRRLFFTVYKALCTSKDSDSFLHPDTIWNIDVLDARIAQLKHQFINANLQLVVAIARQYDFGMVPLVDLVQEGNMGLMAALDRFDHTMGFRFSTFAYSWIRNAIRKALAHQGMTVRVPPRVIDEQHRVRVAIEKYGLKHGCPPTDLKLAELLGVSMAKLKRIQARHTTRVYSLNTSDRDESTPGQGNVLIDENCDLPEDSVMLKAWLRKKDRLLDALTHIEKAIICWRFGLEDGNEKTLRQIGAECNLSKERIRQIQNIALKKLYLAFTGM